MLLQHCSSSVLGSGGHDVLQVQLELSGAPTRLGHSPFSLLQAGTRHGFHLLHAGLGQPELCASLALPALRNLGPPAEVRQLHLLQAARPLGHLAELASRSLGHARLSPLEFRAKVSNALIPLS